METSSENQEKIKIYITIEPLGIKIGAVFKKKETFQSIINFVFPLVGKSNEPVFAIANSNFTSLSSSI